MVLQLIFNNLNWQSEGMKVNKDRLTHLRFADDIVLFADTSKKLEKIISTLNEESEKVGLKMNEDKTKTLVKEVLEGQRCSTDDEHPRCPINSSIMVSKSFRKDGKMRN